MEHQPRRPANWKPGAVKRISQDGMPQTVHVNPDLVTASGGGLDFEQGRPGQALPDPVMGRGGLAPLPDPHAARAELSNRSVDHAILRNHAFNQGQIGLSHRARFELGTKQAVRAGVFRENNQAAGLAVDAVNYENPAPQVLGQTLVERFADLSPSPDDHHPGRFVDRDQALILVDDRRGVSHVLVRGKDRNYTIPVASASILIVDDEAAVVDVFTQLLEQSGHRIRGAGSAEEAIALVAKQDFDLIFLDLGLPGISGLEAIAALAAETKAPIIIMTGHADEEVKTDALMLGAKAFLAKPVQLEALKACIAQALGEA